MKQCPKCSEVYSDQLQFCMIDGNPLVKVSEDETAPPAPAVDDDYDTVINPARIVIDIPVPAPAPEPVYPDALPPQPEPPGRRVNVIAVLIAGTIIGGLLVLVAILVFALVFKDRSGAE